MKMYEVWHQAARIARLENYAKQLKDELYANATQEQLEKMYQADDYWFGNAKGLQRRSYKAAWNSKESREIRQMSLPFTKKRITSK